MIPERLDFLNSLDRFYQVITEQVKQDNISEAEFYMLLGSKCKALNRERINRGKTHYDCAGSEN